MNFKKKVSDSWVDVPHYIASTDTETITTLPATIYPLGQTATIGLKGNTVQNGIPTPSTPIYPTECGDLVTSGEHAGQYEIPISSAGQTTPVYLGEVQSTRQIKKLVLTGEENWDWISNGTGSYARLTIGQINSVVQNAAISSHFEQSEIISATTIVGVDVRNVASQNSATLNIRPNNADTQDIQSFTGWLSDQYAASIPVCVWYVLATETTGILNEPIRKIGDYADSVSVSNLPTTAGSQTFDVDTTLKPSEVSLTYHGWHPVQSVHERDNGAWT